MDQFLTLFDSQPPWAQAGIGLLLLVLLALAVNFLLKRVLLQLAKPFLDTRSLTADRAAARLATVAPLLVIAYGIELVPHLYDSVWMLIQNVALASIVLSIATGVSKALDYIDEVYRRRPDAHMRPIKGYVQVLKIVIYCGAAVLAIAALIEQSPLLLLSGLGAMAAVLLLVFKDTLLSLVHPCS